MADNFELLYSGKANQAVPVLKYRSKRTGLTVCIAQVEGPLVNGYFCLATEAHDDDGLPHTLEHLVFMGSEEYPYKGVLDLLANRCLASGTNAWTDTDHTCYTMTTAGSDGFLTLMPIYLDHVLYPTLTESGYVTEVHHVNGEGEDAGVVYCEMQARENSGESRSHLAMLREMYPGVCGYKSETGGIMENLRISTSHKKVCDYHKEFYRSENLCLIITGQVEPEKVFEALKPFEDKVVSKPDLPAYSRPWQAEVPSLGESVTKVVKYPSDDEASGMVYVAWRGPLAKEQYLVSGIMVLMEYLTDTAVAPLQRDFVELDDPFCSRVRYSIIENSETCVYISFANVPKEKLTTIQGRLMGLLEKVSKGTEQIDMTRMANVVHRRVLEAMNHLEDQPHDTLAFICIGDGLYGNTSEDIEQRLNQLKALKKLGGEDLAFWTGLVSKYFMGKHSVTIIGEPSKSLMEEMGKEEKERTAKQAESLGPDGLKKKTERLEKATEDNELEAPETVITNVSVPDVGCIKFHTLQPSNNHSKSAANANPKFPLADIPFAMQVDDMKTNFVQLYGLLNTENVPAELKPYLPLYLETLLESPILRDGVEVPYEEVINQLAADTVNNGSSLGVNGGRFSAGSFSQLAIVELKVEMEKYSKGVQWLSELLFSTVFTAERLKIIASKMANGVASMKRNGRRIVQTLMKELNFNKESNHYNNSMLRQHKFLTKLLTTLDSKPQEVIDTMKKLRGILTEPQNITVHLSANLENLAKHTDPVKPWADFLSKPDKESQSVRSIREFLYPEGAGPGTGVIVGVGSVESNFFMQTVKCVDSFLHPDLPALMVYLQYLTQLEGPMWRQIRGLGLAYHYSMFILPETGLLYLILYKSTHVVNAYKQAQEIVMGYVEGKSALSEVELETCKSSLIFEIIERESTVSDTALQSLLSYYRNVDKNYNRDLLQKVAKVTMSDLKRVGQEYLPSLFDAKKSRCGLVCHPTKVEEIQKGFKEFGRELTDLKSLEESFLADWA